MGGQQQHSVPMRESGVPVDNPRLVAAYAWYGDVEQWYDREWQEAVRDEQAEAGDKGHGETGQSSFATLSAVKWYRECPYVLLDEESEDEAGGALLSRTAASSVAQHPPPERSGEHIGGEPGRKATKRRRAGALNATATNAYLHAVLDELHGYSEQRQREMERADGAASPVVFPEPRTPPRKSRRRAAAAVAADSRASSPERRSASPRESDGGSSNRRVATAYASVWDYRELARRVDAGKYDSTDAFAADLSLMLSSSGGGHSHRAKASEEGTPRPTREALRQAADDLRHRLFQLLRRPPVKAEPAAKASGTPSPAVAGTTPGAAALSALRQLHRQHQAYVTQQMQLAFAERDAAPDARLVWHLDVVESGEVERAWPEMFMGPCLPDLHRAVRPPSPSRAAEMNEGEGEASLTYREDVECVTRIHHLRSRILQAVARLQTRTRPSADAQAASDMNHEVPADRRPVITPVPLMIDAGHDAEDAWEAPGRRQPTRPDGIANHLVDDVDDDHEAALPLQPRCPPPPPPSLSAPDTERLPLEWYRLRQAVAAVLYLGGFARGQRSALDTLTEMAVDYLQRLGRALTAHRDAREAADGPAPSARRSRCFPAATAASADTLAQLATEVGASGLRGGFASLMRYREVEVPAMRAALRASEKLLQERWQHVQAMAQEAGVEVERWTDSDDPHMAACATEAVQHIDEHAALRLFGAASDRLVVDVLQLDRVGAPTAAVPYALAAAVCHRMEAAAKGSHPNRVMQRPPPPTHREADAPE